MLTDDIHTADDLHAFIAQTFDVSIARAAATRTRSAPFDYLIHTFFEGLDPANPIAPASPPDCILWANRGGGKTFLGALATALDLISKPGIQVRILAGSLEQAARMHDHLRAFFERPALSKLLKGKVTDRRIALTSGARVELLAQSQASVRGTRPQKLRCDEVELFDPDVWSAAQLTTRSKRIKGRLIRGSIEALSTMHLPHGLMSRLINEAADGSRRLFKWGITDTLERCPALDCSSCSLHDDCQGAAKDASGHVPVADARTLMARVSGEVWQSEMLCNRPSRRHAVFPEFTRETHTVTTLPDSEPVAWLAGMDFGYRSPTVFLWAALHGSGAPGGDALYIVDEHNQSGLSLHEHIRVILASPHPRPHWIGADPAGRARHEQTGTSNIACLQRAGFAVRSRTSEIKEGLEEIRARLRPADGAPPRLYIHARCGRLIESLEAYHYDPDRPASEDPVKDGPDHAIDALRYLIINLDRGYRVSRGAYL